MERLRGKDYILLLEDPSSAEMDPICHACRKRFIEMGVKVLLYVL